MNLYKETATSVRAILRNQETNLLSLTTPHERWLSSLVVDVSPEILQLGLRGCFGLFNGGIDFSLGLLVEFLERYE